MCRRRPLSAEQDALRESPITSGAPRCHLSLFLALGRRHFLLANEALSRKERKASQLLSVADIKLSRVPNYSAQPSLLIFVKIPVSQQVRPCAEFQALTWEGDRVGVNELSW